MSGRDLPTVSPSGVGGDHMLLAIVPARSASKAVPFKNVRRLGDKPLIAHTVKAVVASAVADRLVVSSDDDQVLRWAELHGHETHVRPGALADDEATISGVATYVAEDLDWGGIVAVFQPTSPFRTPESIVRAVEAFRNADADSLASCVREPHTLWLDTSGDLGRARPLFERRVNRQYAHHAVLRETGSIQLVRAAALRAGGEMVTGRHLLFEVDAEESLDIDTKDDLMLARRRFDRGTVVFRIRATAKIGSGHVHHCMQLADELADQQLQFLLHDCDPFVGEMLAEHGYDHRVETDLAADLRALAGAGPNLVVNDVLDTGEREVLVQRGAGYRVVNIEDLGMGAKLADWVVNALYPTDNKSAEHVVTGPAYATLRSEFLDLPEKLIRAEPQRVLVTFGGTDPAGLAARCAHLLSRRIDAEIRVVLGAGAVRGEYPAGVEVMRQVRSMAAEMLAADLVVTAAGRTVYEAAAVGTPVVAIAQGARDATHAHLDFRSGVVFLGIGPLVDDEHILGVVRRLLSDQPLRAELSERLRTSIDGRGASRIADRIRALLQGLDG